MARLSDVYPSKYIRAEDLAGRPPITATIECAEVVTIGDERKVVAHFIGASRGLVLNRTNARACSEICGSDDTDNWCGARIKIVPIRVNYQGRMVASLRIEPIEVAPAADVFGDAPSTASATVAPRVADPFGGKPDDGMPF